MRRAAGALLAGLLAGCAARPAPSPPPVAAAPAAAPAQGVDGTYIGPTRLVEAHARGCPRSTVRTLTVLDRSFDVLYRSTPSVSQSLTVWIAADNTIHAEDGTGLVDGRWHDGLIDISVVSPWCQTRMVLRQK